MASILTVDNIVTDVDLRNESGAVVNAEPDPDERNAARQRALEDVERSLQSRTPPVHPNDLTDTSEIKDAILYRALERIYRDARSHETDRWGLLAKDYAREYRGAMSRPFTVYEQARVASDGISITVERR